jgi:hypothetical protein
LLQDGNGDEVADIVRRSSGGLVTSDAGPGKDPSSIEFSRNPLQQWWGIEDIPQNIVNQFHQKSLFPNQLVMDELGTPIVENGKIVIAGWIVGTQSFTSFQITKGQSESESSWQVKGNVVRFKSDAEVRKSMVPVDPIASTPGKPTVSAAGQDERLESAHTLPAQLRRMLLSVSSPTFYSSTIWQYEPDFPAASGEFMRYQVPTVSVNANLLVAIHAQQRVDFNGGESKAAAQKMISTAPWDTKVVRAFI